MLNQFKRYGMQEIIRQTNNRERQLKLRMQSAAGAVTVFNGRTYDYFSGCGYLGLQTHPDVIGAAVEALKLYGVSTATSRGSYGEHTLYDELEREACVFFGAERSLYFASGYLGASILVQGCAHSYEHIFIDSAAHYSLWDAAQATGRPITPFRHRCPEHLEESLKGELLPGERPLILSDGVFPISGEIAPLPEYIALTKQYCGLVCVDDAHAAGVLGEHGRGTLEHFGINGACFRSCATLSKALGGYGGIICGDAAWIDEVERRSSACVGASPPPLPIAAASARALMIARTEPGLRKRLRENTAMARRGFVRLGWKLEDTPVPVICLPARDGTQLQQIKNRLFEDGIAVSYVRSYTSTPAGGALRVAVFATHTTEQIEHLLSAFSRAA